jgi:hypothetical protein
MSAAFSQQRRPGSGEATDEHEPGGSADAPAAQPDALEQLRRSLGRD